MAFSIRHLKIRHQIFLVSLPPLFVLLCSLALMLYAFWVAGYASRTTSSAEESIARGEALLRHLTEMDMGVRGYLLTGRQALLGVYDEDLGRVPTDLEAWRETYADDAVHVARVREIREEVNRWLDEWAKPTLEKSKRGELADTSSRILEGEKRLESLRTLILKHLGEHQERRLARERQVNQLVRRMLFLGLGITLVLGAGLLFLTRTVTRLIAEPVLHLIEASDQVSRGDLRPSLPPFAENEFGVLSRSFARMTAALREEREEMAALSRFSEAVTQCTVDREVYAQLLHSFRESFQPQQVIIFTLNAEENYLEAVATLAPLPDKLQDWPVIEEPRSCKAVRMGRPFHVEDVAHEPLCPANFAPPTEGNYYCGPLIAGGVIIGAVRLEGLFGPWNREREKLLESYLSSAASALANLQSIDTMKRQANIDLVTGLYNRRFVEDYARKQIAMARRKEHPLGLIMMDIDHFKKFNDLYGHDAGDRVLRQVAKTVTVAMRETNLVARFGGEEFLVMLPETGAKACWKVAERIRQAVERMSIVPGGEKPTAPVTVSLGIAVYPDHGRTFEEALQAADRALYESKRGGRNRSTLYVEQAEPAG